MEIPFSMLLYERWGAGWSLHPRNGHGGFGGEGVVEKKIVKKAAPAAAVCECVWVKKRSLIDTIDSEASRLRQYRTDWSAPFRFAFFRRSNEAVHV